MNSKSRYNKLTKHIEEEDQIEKRLEQDTNKLTLEDCSSEQIEDINYFYNEYSKEISKRQILRVLLDNDWDFDRESLIFEQLDEQLAIQQSEEIAKQEQKAIEKQIKNEQKKQQPKNQNSNKQPQNKNNQEKQSQITETQVQQVKEPLKKPELKIERKFSESSQTKQTPGRKNSGRHTPGKDGHMFENDLENKPLRKKSMMEELEEQMHSNQLNSKKISSDILQNFVKHEEFDLKSRNIKQYNEPYPLVNHKILDQEQQNQSLRQFNMVFVGHVDSGKSTLIGHLLYLIKELAQHQLDKFAKNINKESFMYAWNQDERADERARGVTIDLSYKVLYTVSKKITILDCPGHQDFVPKMISGACQAEYAVLVIDAGINSFEGGFMKGGQTKEHAWLVKALGASQVIIAINKMDLVNWDQKRYNYIQQMLIEYMTQIGFKEEQISFIPISAFHGINLNNKLENHKWYKGDCLLQKIENLPLPNRDDDKPVRFNIYSSHRNNRDNKKGIILMGKVEGGAIIAKDKLVILPHGLVVGVYQIFKDGHKVDQIHIGDNAEIVVQMKNEHEEQLIRSGDVMSSINYSIPISKKVVVEFVAFEISSPITKGMCGISIFINTAVTEGRIKKISKLIDKRNGQILKKNPQTIKSYECAEMELSLNNLVCCELFSNLKVYGRVIIREGAITLGVGMITQIL